MTFERDSGPAAPARLLFIGGTPRGLRVVQALLRRGTRLAGLVVLQEDAHEDPGARLALTALGQLHDVPSRVTGRLSAEDSRHLVETLRPDLVLSVGWRTMLPPEIVQAPPLGCVGVHDSPLPRYRGFAPTNWAVINGETRWGVTLFHLADGVDEGDVVGQEFFDVDPRVTAPQLYEQTVQATVTVVERFLDDLLRGTAPRTPQDHALATYACARTPRDGRIDWRASTVAVDRLVRGLTPPYPGAWTTWRGQPLVVHEAHPVHPAPVWEGRVPGRVVGFDDRTADVLTGDGVLRLVTVALDGGPPQPAGTVLRAVRRSLGEEP